MTDRAVTSAFVAPAGGANPGDGVTPVPAYTVLIYRHPSPPPGMRTVEGRWSDPPPLALSRGWARTAGCRYNGPHLKRTDMRLLIVEDDRDAADYIARAFREVGHIADQAPDGEEGLALATDRQYDVLIIDRMLP